MYVTKGDLASVAGNPAVWVVVATGPYWTKVRNADPSYAQTVVNVPTDDVSPYNPAK